jgi:1,4-alpha-glucan branching enzyme
MMLKNISVKTRAAAMLAMMLAVTTAGCFLTNMIQNRLPAPHPTDKGILFQYEAPSAKYVNLAGNFNTWGGTEGTGRFDPTIDPMTDEDGDGIWQIYKELRPGRYQYKYVIDNGVRWVLDPSNPNQGEEGGFVNSLIIVK